MFLVLGFVLVLAALASGSDGTERRIKTPADFISFANDVANGSNYKGSTVLLDSDITFSESISPIGNLMPGFHFQGTFDGQGHTISNLTVVSSSPQYVGLFGYSDALAFMNVVLDSTCSVTSSYPYAYAHAGGIIGRVYATLAYFKFENIVSMGSVLYAGNSTKIAYVGGLIGGLSSGRAYSYVKNCANYGPVTSSGPGGVVYVGGIFGFTESYFKKVVQNCFNYGTITHTGEATKELYIGGIFGHSFYVNIENCLSAGRIESLYLPNETFCYRSIIGEIGSSGTYITHCYWTNGIGANRIHGTGWPRNVTETPEYPVDGVTAVDVLNERAKENGWNGWLLNTNNKSVSFKINGNKVLSLNSHVTLLPETASKEGMVFGEWYADSLFKVPFQSMEVVEDITLYGTYGVGVTVAFKPNGGFLEQLSKRVVYNSTYGFLPTPSMTGYSFDGWFTERDGGEKIASGTVVSVQSNHTLYAHWIINNYILTFDFGNGTTVINVLKFNETIMYPRNMLKEGYTFDKWNPEPKIVPASNLTVIALWIINNYTLRFDFKNGTVIERVLKFNETIMYPRNMLKEGYTFDKWDPEPKVVPANNITMIALWIINNYTLTFAFGNGTTVKSILKFNETIGYPENMLKEGYTFDKWDPKPKVVPANNLTVIALWIVNNYTLRFDFKNGTVIERALKFNETIIYPEIQERKGHKFKWSTSTERMPAHNLTVFAVRVEKVGLGKTLLIVGIVVQTCIVVVAIASISLMKVLKREKKKKKQENEVEPLLINGGEEL